MTKNSKKNSPCSVKSVNRPYFIFLPPFPTIDAIIAEFRKPDFLKLTLRKRFRQINQTLYQLIQESPSPAFLLSAVLDFFSRVNQEKVLQEPLNFASFEFWLNHFSNIIRAGKL